MTAGLETFAKVRALHDRATIPGEKAAAMTRMQTLARRAGMSVEQAVSKLDAPKPAAPRNLFEELFNTPEFRAQRAERQQRYADRRLVALAEYGSEDAVWELNDRERALEEACRPAIVRKPIINGEMNTLQGWDGGSWGRLPREAQEAVARAYLRPASVREAWTEFQFWEKLGDDRIAFFPDYDHDLRVRARTAFIEHLLDTMPARSMSDLRSRFDWMQHINEREWNRGNPEDATVLATLRADIERMGARLREQDAEAVQSGQGQRGAKAAPHPSAVHDGHPRRTNADKRRDVIAPLDVGKSDNARLTDREVARRAGVSPTTVGTIKRSLA